VLDAMQRRLDRNPDAKKIRRRTVEQVFGTLKYWMGCAHFLMKTLVNVPTEINLHGERPAIPPCPAPAEPV
jgi:hypothetical protein